MAFVTIDPLTIEVGDPQTAELWNKVKDNLDDLDSRLTAFGGTGKISIFNEKIEVGVDANLTGFLDYEIIQACSITEFAIQLYEKSPASSGSLTLDLKKNTDTNPAGFNSIMTVLPTISMASADYSRNAGTINTGLSTLSVGNIVRVDITALPTGLQKFRLVVVGELS